MAHNGGRACVNLTLTAPYYDWPFLNACKAQSYPWTASGASDDAWYQNYDSRGYPTQMPNGGGATWITNQLYMYGADGDVWVLDWPGTATLVLSQSFGGGGTITLTSSASNRLEYRLNSPSGGFFANGVSINPALLCRITISSMSSNAFASGDIRLFRKDQESLLNAGQVFDPGFASRIGKFGCVRFLNWCFSSPKGVTSLGQWVNRKTTSSYSYFAYGEVLSSIYCGTSTGTNAQVVSDMPSAPGPWTQGMMVQWKLGAVPVWRTPSAATNASPATFTDVGHGLTTGDQIYFNQDFSGWKFLTQGGANNIFQIWSVTVVDVDHFSVPFDSTSSGAWPSVSYAKVMTLKRGSLSPVPCIMKTSAVNINNVNFGSINFAVGDVVTGIYDSGFGCLMLDRNQDAGASPSNVSSLYAGVPFDVMVLFCNQNRCHPWICVPPFFDDASLTSLANFLVANLDGSLIPRIEWANEVWNYDITGYASARARSDLGGANFHWYYGKRVSEISALFAAAYAGSGKTYKIIMGVQSTFIASPFTIDRFIDLPYTGRAVSSISIASPAVVTTTAPHLLNINDQVILYSDTHGLPSPFVDSVYNNPASPTVYYVIAPGFSATTVQLSAILGGPAINTSGSASGNITIAKPAIINCDIVAHAPYFVPAFTFTGNAATYPNSTAAGGWADQVWNYTQGGSARQTAFNWYKNENINNSQDPVNFPTQQPISLYQSTVIPFWKVQTNAYGKELDEYEGGQGVSGTGSSLIGISGGFPVTAPTSGQTVTVADVRNFYIDFLQSSQYADLTTLRLNNSANLGTKFPSQYTCTDTWNDGYYWGIYPLNLSVNGIANNSPTLAYTALRLFNDPVILNLQQQHIIMQ